MISTSKYPRGSEWRRWDLHIHSPASVLSNNFEGQSVAEKWEKYVAKLESLEGIAAVGITDYFSIDGYQTLKRFKDSGQLSNIDLILPNVELRMLPVTQQEHPINLHFIFSPSVVDTLESQFFQDLEFRYSANIYRCTRADLVRLGRDFSENETLDEDAAYKEGVNQFKINLDQLRQLIEKNESLRHGSLVAVSNRSREGASGIQHSSLAATRQEVYRLAHVVFSGNPNDIQYFLGEGADAPEIVNRRYGSLKPCVNGSDAHDLSRICNPDQDRFTWIKADPTFEGLRQIFNEPKDRVFVGRTPQSLIRVAARPTRFAKEVAMRKRPNATTQEKWFNQTLPLNPELIAIIGNKGSGKSALADILGLLGNTARYESFSFLEPNRFCDPKNNKARQFEASLTWQDGTTEGPLPLDQKPSLDEVEKVRYIPQDYLERICNEIELGKGSRFYSELQAVIFSHVPEEERLGFSSLDELLDHRAEETEKAIEFLSAELKDINRKIISCEEQLTDAHRKMIESQLAEKQRELIAHDQAKPKEVKKPEDDPQTVQQSRLINDALEKEQAKLTTLEMQIADCRKTQGAMNKKRSDAEKLLGKIENLQRQVARFLADSRLDFAELDLQPADIVSLRVNTVPIQKIIEACDAELQTLKPKLDERDPASLESIRRNSLTSLKGLQEKLSAPQREYQQYIETVRKWTAARNKIIGTDRASGSIKHLENMLARLAEVPNQLKGLDRLRDKKMLEVYREKQRLRGYYRTYYGAVQRFLDEHPLTSSQPFGLMFNVSIVESGFKKPFLGFIDHRKTGSFSGLEEGEETLQDILKAANFDSALGTLRFTRRILKALREDTREGRRGALAITDQISQGMSVTDLYDYIFSLEYLSPVYNLRWEGKSLEQLSPGERGNLLLIFYLLVDLDDVPFVIDQPEENLDNQTVFETLVPCIKDAKKRRQIIIVTHNPNLAVVCDAEQVICAEIKKDERNEVVYTSGSIEDLIINKKAIDVLEGTRPAFDKRDSKYLKQLSTARASGAI